MDSAAATKLSGIAAGATVGATWGTNLNSVPATLSTPGSAGLYLSSTYLGYYNGATWKTYMDSSGNFSLAGTGADGLTWNGSILSITGAITLTNTIAVGSVTGLGALATANSVDLATGQVTNKSLANVDSAAASKLSGIAAGATVGATWGTNLYSVPATLGTPGSAGLYLSSTYLGYYNGATWKTYMDSAGNFSLAGTGAQGLAWDGATLSITGAIHASTGSIDGTLTMGASGKIDMTYVDLDNSGIRVSAADTWTIARSYRFVTEDTVPLTVGGLFVYRDTTFNGQLLTVNYNPLTSDAFEPGRDAFLTEVARSKGNAQEARVTLNAVAAKSDGTAMQAATISIISRPSTVGLADISLTAGNITLTGAAAITGTLNVTGALTQNGHQVYYDGNLPALDYVPMTGTASGRDADDAWTLGRMKLGNVVAGYAGFSHRYVATATGFALLQNHLGATMLNAPTGQQIYLKNNNNDIARVHDTGIDMASGMTINNLTPYRRDGAAGYIFVPLAVPVSLTDTGNVAWSNPAEPTELAANQTRTFRLTSAGAPATAKAALIMIGGVFWNLWPGTPASAPYIAVEDKAASNARVAILNAAISGQRFLQQVIIPLDSATDFDVYIGQSYLRQYTCRLIGYFL